jgi:hypothetical protein
MQAIKPEERSAIYWTKVSIDTLVQYRSFHALWLNHSMRGEFEWSAQLMLHLASKAISKLMS